jgi:hypothetical protein
MPSQPLGIAITLIALLTAPGCDPGAQDPSPVQNGNDVATQHQSYTRLLQTQNSGYTEPAERVLRDQAAYAQAWLTIHEGLAEDPPAVDFRREMVVLLALGERPTGGFTTQLEEFVREGDDARVRYSIAAPGRECMTTQAMTAPVDLVRVPRVEGAVGFERRQVVRPC